MDQKQNKQNSGPAGQKSAPCHQNPKLRGLRRLWENCLSSNYLMLDILTPATSISCAITTGVPLPCSSHGAKFPKRRARIRCCAVSSSCAAAGESRLDLPLSKSTREGGCCRSRGDYRSYSCPMSHSKTTESQWHFSHSSLLDNEGDFTKRPVRKKKRKPWSWFEPWEHINCLGCFVKPLNYRLGTTK